MNVIETSGLGKRYGTTWALREWIEGSWLFALSLFLIAATIWLVRRRTA